MDKYSWPTLTVISSMALSLVVVWALSDATCVYKDGWYSRDR